MSKPSGEDLDHPFWQAFDLLTTTLTGALAVALVVGIWVLPKLEQKRRIEEHLVELEEQVQVLEHEIAEFRRLEEALRVDPYAREAAVRFLFSVKRPHEEWLFARPSNRWSHPVPEGLRPDGGAEETLAAR